MHLKNQLVWYSLENVNGNVKSCSVAHRLKHETAWEISVIGIPVWNKKKKVTVSKKLATLCPSNKRASRLLEGIPNQITCECECEFAVSNIYVYLELSTSSAKAPNKNSWVVLKTDNASFSFKIHY